MPEYVIVYRIRDHLFAVPSTQYGGSTEDTVRAVIMAANYFGDDDNPQGKWKQGIVCNVEYVGTARVAAA